MCGFKFRFLLFLLPLLLRAQIEDSILLKEVVVEGNRLRNFSAGNTLQSIDSAALHHSSASNLGDLLAQQSLIFVKSAGPGNLATLSLRGTGAAHTAVLWNGFNIQGPTLGQADFSLLPVSLCDNVEIQYGGAGALFGSGAVGGVVHLNNAAKYNTGLRAGISASAGSFGTFHQHLNLSYSGVKSIHSLRLFNTQTQNDYPFINTALEGSPRVRQTHADNKQQGILLENFFRITRRNHINLRVWFQDNFRNIPPPMTNAISDASLGNKIWRLSSEWKHSGTKISWAARTAYFNDRMTYEDTLTNQYSEIDFQTSITEAECLIPIRSLHRINIGINNTFNFVLSDGIPDSKNQHRTAAFISYKVQNTKNTWRTSASVRQEFIGNTAVPITPSLGTEGDLSSRILLKATISRNYRVPTFNDLYWSPGGNPDLKPESGWSEEAGIILHPKNDLKNKIGFTAFNSNVENWIIWLPTSEIWSPQNIQSVWSRGLEVNATSYFKIGKVEIEISGMYNYVLSTNQKAKSEFDNSVDKQLIYVPMYNAQGQSTIRYRNFRINYIHSYTGNRFTLADNTKYVKGYQLGHISLSKNITVKKIKVELHTRINNVWNKAYQIMLWQAMPGRSYSIGASLFFHNPNTKKESN